MNKISNIEQKNKKASSVIPLSAHPMPQMHTCMHISYNTQKSCLVHICIHLKAKTSSLCIMNGVHRMYEKNANYMYCNINIIHKLRSLK